MGVRVPEELIRRKRMQDAIPAVMGHQRMTHGGLGGSTDLGFIVEALRPEKAEVAHFGVARASDIGAHAMDEFVNVAALVTVTKELAYYLAA
jgi:hypothetical protein